MSAALLAGTSSSSSTGAVAMTASTQTASGQTADTAQFAQVLPATANALAGFTPPPDKTEDPEPQFRIAANLPAGPLGIPGIVLQAYKLGAKRVAAENPQCKLPWFLLAGIGRIESGHAGNGNVDAYGNTLTKIRGPVLDGSLAGNAVIHDSDGGKLDGDTGHDRAMGPMQFIPSTWAAWGADANGDGKADPDNVFDTAYSAGRYLCAGVTDIMAASHRVAAVLRYNHSVAYANNVIGWALAYSTGVVPVGGIPEMNSGAPKKVDKDKKAKDAKKDGDKNKPGQSTPPSRTPAKPTPAAPPTCLGTVCLPPGLVPGQPAPKQNRPASQKPTAKATVTPR
ncbi:MAG: lytic murein transglycosylase [Gordonia sp. (in: high G+C Gram-positive bacteria)]